MYDHKAIERKWRKRWEEEKTFRCDTHDFSKPKFYALDINLSTLESRPIVGSDFEFMFYFDIEAEIDKESVIKLMSELSASLERFVFLGAYSEL